MPRQISYKYHIVTIRPCFFSSSIIDFALLSLILLFERLTILRRGTLSLEERSRFTASSVSWLNERLRLVTDGRWSRILQRPSVVNLFFTSFRPLIFLNVFTNFSNSWTYKSQRDWQLRSRVSWLHFSQNSEIISSTVNGSISSWADDTLLILLYDPRLLFISLGVSLEL